MTTKTEPQYKLTPVERKRRWEDMLSRHAPRSRRRHDRHSDGTDDPFDCSDLCVPSVHDAADREVARAAAAWRELDARRIDTTVATGKRLSAIRLPRDFDYKSMRGPPETDDESRCRVVSLANPMESSDYETELWKIFASVPTMAELEKRRRGPTPLHVEQLKRDVDRAQRELTRTDSYALARMRMKDRHHRPLSTTTTTISDGHDSTDNDNTLTTIIRFECWKRQLKRGSVIQQDRLEMEFLGTHTLQDVHDTIVKQANDPLSRFFNSGMFFIEDTFYLTGDVDYAAPVIEWLEGDNNNDGSDSDESSDSDKGSGSDGGDNNQGDENDNNSNNDSDNDNNTVAAGNITNPADKFVTTYDPLTQRYTTLRVPVYDDTVLREDDDTVDQAEQRRRQHTRRRHLAGARRDHLGIARDVVLRTVRMSSVALDDLPVRLGVRYVHTLHGDLETSLFVTDVRVSSSTTTPGVPSSPCLAILDHWSSKLPSSQCEVCNHSAAVVVTVDDVVANDGFGFGCLNAPAGSKDFDHNSCSKLCAGCYFRLHYDEEGQLRKKSGESFRVYPLSLYEEDMSTSRETCRSRTDLMHF